MSDWYMRNLPVFYRFSTDLVVYIRELLVAMPSEVKADLGGEFLTTIAEQPNEILKCAMYLFLGNLDGATQYVSLASRSLANVGRRPVRGRRSRKLRPQFAQSCGGVGTSSDLPWGRDPDEDDRRFA